MARRRLAGTMTVVRFNWPKYAAVVGLLGASAVARQEGWPPSAVALLGVAGGVGSAWSATSILATWWVYDHRRVYEHIVDEAGRLGHWASVHAGFDDATAVLAGGAGGAPSAVVELSIPSSPSLRRARRRGAVASAAGTVGRLPLATASLDTIFVTFAAHEVRHRDAQRALFIELHRALRPTGRLVVTEHGRDLANYAVYGPGALHFQRTATWLNRAAEAGFGEARATSITPFVRRLEWHR